MGILWKYQKTQKSNIFIFFENEENDKNNKNTKNTFFCKKWKNPKYQVFPKM